MLKPGNLVSMENVQFFLFQEKKKANFGLKMMFRPYTYFSPLVFSVHPFLSLLFNLIKSKNELEACKRGQTLEFA